MIQNQEYIFVLLKKSNFREKNINEKHVKN